MIFPMVKKKILAKGGHGPIASPKYATVKQFDIKLSLVFFSENLDTGFE